MENKDMNIYLISQEVNNDWNTYDSAIVAAESVEDAKTLHPDGIGCASKQEVYNSDVTTYFPHDWCYRDDVKVELLGVAMQGTKKMVLLASFNAG